jgi:hypothetical protein
MEIRRTAKGSEVKGEEEEEVGKGKKAAAPEPGETELITNLRPDTLIQLTAAGEQYLKRAVEKLTSPDLAMGRPIFQTE